MYAATHARVMEIFNLTGLVVGYPLAFFAFCEAFTSDKIVPIIAFIAVMTVLYLVLWCLPVRCSAPGCVGRMRKKETRLTSFRGRLQYRCAVCGSVYEADIFELPPGDPVP